MQKLKPHFSHKGFTLIELAVVLGITGLISTLVIGVIISLRNKAAKSECANNLRQIGNALHGYHQTKGALPPGSVSETYLYSKKIPPSEFKNFYPRMTWHMRLLPYLEQKSLWNQIIKAYQIDPIVNSSPPHTAKYVKVPIFLCPEEGESKPPWNGPRPGTTTYVGMAGINWYRKTGLLYPDSEIRFKQILDGLSNSVVVGERPSNLKHIVGLWHGSGGSGGYINTTLGVRHEVISRWHDITDCPVGPTHFQPGSLQDPCSVFHYWSFHPGGANFLFADGSVRFLSYSANSILPALATRAGGEIVQIP